MKVLVTCGPTREPLDPVRFISNRSTGTLGIEIARAFAARGHRVVLAAGPIDLPKDLGPRVRVVRFETARDLHGIALKEFKRCDAVCMTAAVADFRPAVQSSAKIKRGKSTRTVRLIPNPDILADLGRRKRPGQVLVGFAVESSQVEARAKAKLIKKKLDLIVAQRVGGGADPFGRVSMNTVVIGRSPTRIAAFSAISKPALAAHIAASVEAFSSQIF
jgi:phosphopantothenoylcysteine decarboxylase/phosphopantothenate--cysteine ligase